MSLASKRIVMFWIATDIVWCSLFIVAEKLQRA